MKSFPLILILFILLTSRLFAAELSENDSLKENEIEQIVIRIHHEATQGGYELMSVTTLKQLVDNKENFVLIDAQPETHYNRAFIDGAKNFEFQGKFTGDWQTDEAAGTETEFKALLGDDRNKKIILSCGGLQCKRSHTAASWVKKLGYRSVYRVTSGIKGWLAAGYPIKTNQ
jgi:rhodanese-related sulfurtransferase